MGYDTELDALDIEFMRTEFADVAPDLDLLIQQHGQEIYLIPRIVCPCADSPRSGGTGTANPACKACYGTGLAYLFSSEQAKTSMRAVVSSAETRKMFTPATPITSGSLRITLPSNVHPVEGDMVRVPKLVQVIDILREYKVKDGGIKVPFDIVSAQYVAIRDGASDIILLEHKTDYTIDADRDLITFPKNGRVRGGYTVSGRFTGIPYYIISSSPSVARGQMSSAFSATGEEEFVEFPKTVLAERTDALFGRF